MSSKKYKLNLYTPNGLLRPEISKGTFAEMSARYGDIIRAASMSYWSTLDELYQSYLNLAKRLRFEPLRSKEQIEIALEEMIIAGLIDFK